MKKSEIIRLVRRILLETVRNHELQSLVKERQKEFRDLSEEELNIGNLVTDELNPRDGDSV
jgi:hypothetical protein